MARPRKDERPESLRGRILEVATELFAERGYAETSLAEIARRVGIRAQSIANHFASKEDLYDAVVFAFYRRQITDLGPIAFGSADEGAALLAGRFSALSVQDRNMLVTITAEALVSGRGAGVVDRELGPVIDVMASALTADSGLPAREVVALVILGMVFALDAPRIPAPTRALRDRILGDRPKMEEAGQLLLNAILPDAVDAAPPPGATQASRTSQRPAGSRPSDIPASPRLRVDKASAMPSNSLPAAESGADSTSGTPVSPAATSAGSSGT